MKSIKSLVLIGIWLALATCLFGQKEVSVQSTTSQTVSVNIDKNDDGKRKVSIVKNSDGREKVIEWEDEGKIPDDIKKRLEEENIDISILNQGEMQVSVTAERDGKPRKQRKIVILSDEDGTLSETEWDDMGDLPKDVQDLLDEYDIDIDVDEEGRGDVKKKVKVLRMDRRERRRRAEDRGRRYDYKVDFKHRPMPKVSDAYMGAQIETTKGGAHVTDVLEGGPADKAGLEKSDVVQRINGARTRSMEDLISLLGYFEPMDEVILSILRDGKVKEIKMKLGKRPGAYR